MKKNIGDSDSYIVDVKELKERFVIDESIGEYGVTCCICDENSYSNKDKKLWLVLKDVGSGSMDDYICSDCIDKINKKFNKIKMELKK